MKALRTVVVLVLALGLSAPVLAADYQAGLEAYERGDYTTALKEWRPLAEQGHAGAQVVLGIMYRHGQGVTKNYAEAHKWYRLAAEQGHVEAQYRLARSYFLHVGVPRDDPEAAKWYRLAAEQGHAGAQASLGSMYVGGRGVTRDYVQAHMWANLAAARLQPGLEHDLAILVRDDAERNMTPDQLAEAQRLAREWKPK